MLEEPAADQMHYFARTAAAAGGVAAGEREVTPVISSNGRELIHRQSTSLHSMEWLHVTDSAINKD